MYHLCLSLLLLVPVMQTLSAQSRYPISVSEMKVDPKDWPEIVKIHISKEARNGLVDDLWEGGAMYAVEGGFQKPYEHCTGIYIAPSVILTLSHCFVHNISDKKLKTYISIEEENAKVKSVLNRDGFVFIEVSGHEDHAFLEIEETLFVDTHSKNLLGLGFGFKGYNPGDTSRVYWMDNSEVAFQSFDVDPQSLFSRATLTGERTVAPLNGSRGSVVVDIESRKLISLFRYKEQSRQGGLSSLFFNDLTSTNFQNAVTDFEKSSQVEIPFNSQSPMEYSAKSGRFAAKLKFISRYTLEVTLYVSGRPIETKKLYRASDLSFSSSTQDRPRNGNSYILLEFKSLDQKLRLGDTVKLDYNNYGKKKNKFPSETTLTIY